MFNWEEMWVALCRTCMPLGRFHTSGHVTQILAYWAEGFCEFRGLSRIVIVTVTVIATSELLEHHSKQAHRGTSLFTSAECMRMVVPEPHDAFWIVGNETLQPARFLLSSYKGMRFGLRRLIPALWSADNPILLRLLVVQSFEFRIKWNHAVKWFHMSNEKLQWIISDTDWQ